MPHVVRLPALESIEGRIRYTSVELSVWRIRSTGRRSAGLATGGAPCEARSILTGNDKSLASAADEALIDGLRKRDQDVVFQLVEAWSSSMLHLALVFVQPRAVAEEVVQDTWIAVLEGIERFESRSTLRTWVFTILTNRAKTRAMRERRSIPFSALEGDGAGSRAGALPSGKRRLGRALGQPSRPTPTR